MNLEERHKDYIRREPNKRIYISLERGYLEYLKEFLQNMGHDDKYYLFLPRNPIDDDKYKAHFSTGIYISRTKGDEIVKFELREITMNKPIGTYVDEYAALVGLPLGYLSPLSEAEGLILMTFFFAGIYTERNYKSDIKMSMRTESGNLIEI